MIHYSFKSFHSSSSKNVLNILPFSFEFDNDAQNSKLISDGSQYDIGRAQKSALLDDEGQEVEQRQCEFKKKKRKKTTISKCWFHAQQVSYHAAIRPLHPIQRHLHLTKRSNNSTAFFFQLLPHNFKRIRFVSEFSKFARWETLSLGAHASSVNNFNNGREICVR